MHYLQFLADVGAADLHPKGRAATHRLVETLGLHDGARILEIGCGTGRTVARIATHYQVQIDGVDPLPEMLRVARQRLRAAPRGGRATLIRADGTLLPLRSGLYDVVYTESVLGIQSPDAARAMLSEIYRVLKAGGLYAANEAIWKSGVTQQVAHSINAACLAGFGLRQASDRAWGASDWIGIMEEAGFERVSAEPLEQNE